MMLGGQAKYTMRGTAALLALAAFAAPAAADTVYLVNGNKFEQVVAERVGGAVRIRLPDGEIVLPDRVVARVVSSSSSWQEYEQRRAALAGSAAAWEWLELARWADGAGYARGARQALLHAARLDPELDGLAPLMAGIGYILDDELGRWLPEAEYMRRRGYRLWGDHWLPREEYEARRQAHQEDQRQRREERRQERITRAIEALVVTQLRRAAEQEPSPEPVATQGPLVGVYGVGHGPLVVSPARVAPPRAGKRRLRYDLQADRQPGSLPPIPTPRHRTAGE